MRRSMQHFWIVELCAIQEVEKYLDIFQLQIYKLLHFCFIYYCYKIKLYFCLQTQIVN